MTLDFDYSTKGICETMLYDNVYSERAHAVDIVHLGRKYRKYGYAQPVMVAGIIYEGNNKETGKHQKVLHIGKYVQPVDEYIDDEKMEEKAMENAVSDPILVMNVEPMFSKGLFNRIARAIILSVEVDLMKTEDELANPELEWAEDVTAVPYPCSEDDVTYDAAYEVLQGEGCSAWGENVATEDYPTNCSDCGCAEYQTDYFIFDEDFCSDSTEQSNEDDCD